MHVKLGLEMDDSTHAMLVEWGKEEATDEDYINIAISNGLKAAIDEKTDQENTGAKPD